MVINPRDLGAKLDAKTDDTLAMQAALDKAASVGYCTITLDGVARITKRLVYGGMPVQEMYATKPNLKTQPTYSLDEHNKCYWTLPFSFIGEGKAGIYADFVSDVPTASLYVGAWGDKRASPVRSVEKYNLIIKNIGFWGKGLFDSAGNPIFRALTDIPVNKTIGLVNMHTKGAIIENCTFIGMNRGQVDNNAYYSVQRNNGYEWCDIPLESTASNGAKIYDPTIYYSNKGIVLRSHSCLVSGYVAEHNNSALQITGNFNHIVKPSFETYKESNEGQLIIGQNPTDADYIAGNTAQGTIIENLSLAVINRSATIPRGIEFRETARNVVFIGGNAQSCGLINYKHADTRVCLIGMNTTNFPATSQTKILF